MKASEYINKKPELQYKEPKKRFFTGDNVSKIIGNMVSLVIVFLLLSTGKWAMEFMIDHQPVKLTQAQIDSAVVKLVKPDTVRIVKPDTLTIPVEYKYVDSHFTSNGDTTYWFLTGRLFGPNDYSYGMTRVIKLPYSHFDFYQATQMIIKRDSKANDAVIEYFSQISKATFISYNKYAKHS